MNAVYSATTRQGDAELTELLQATACLEEIIGSSADQVQVEWDRS